MVYYFRLEHTLLDLAGGASWSWLGTKGAEAKREEV
jgi:hypothetical protein